MILAVMVTPLRWISCAALVLALCGAAVAQERVPLRAVRTVVWIEIADGRDDARFRRAWDHLGEIDVVLVRETAQREPTIVEAIETILVHRALAVVWHASDGTLQILFEGEGSPERVSARSGAAAEEGLYLRELVRGRVDGDDAETNLLVTVPGEVVEEKPLSNESPSPQSISLQDSPGEHRAMRGLMLGVGYLARAHTDSVTWWQHCVQFIVPAWRIDDLWVVRGILHMGMPSSIGESGTEWLQIRTVGGDITFGLIPFRGNHVELELGLGAGMVNSIAVAFTADGESVRQEHMSGEVLGWAALLWHPTSRVMVRLLVEGARILTAPSFSINGKGDFGEFPWQPSLGLDITVSLSRK